MGHHFSGLKHKQNSKLREQAQKKTMDIQTIIANLCSMDPKFQRGVEFWATHLPISASCARDVVPTLDLQVVVEFLQNPQFKMDPERATVENFFEVLANMSQQAPECLQKLLDVFTGEFKKIDANVQEKAFLYVLYALYKYTD